MPFITASSTLARILHLEIQRQAVFSGELKGRLCAGKSLRRALPRVQVSLAPFLCTIRWSPPGAASRENALGGLPSSSVINHLYQEAAENFIWPSTQCIPELNME